MTLDEAIKHAEEVANGMTTQGECPECAADHRQLAEWLKELKRLKEQEPILDKIMTEIQKLRGCSCSCSDGVIDDVEDIIDKYKAESEVIE